MNRGALLAIALLPGTCLAAGKADPVLWRNTAVERALQSAAEVADPYRRAEVETGIARAQARIGELSAAERTLHTALKSAEAISEPTFQGWVLHEIVLAQIAANDLIGARETAQLIRSERPRGAALLEIALFQLRAGNSDAALRTALGIDDATAAGQALRQIVAAQVAKGDLPAARRTWKQIDDPFYRGQAAGDIAVADVRAGNVPQALALASGVKRAHRAQVFERIAVEQADAGDLDGALKTIDEIAADLDRALVLARISTRPAVRRDRERAQALFSRAAVTLQGAEDPGQRKALSWSHVARMRIAIADPIGANQCLASALASAAKMREGPRRDDAYDAIARTQIRLQDGAGALATAAQIDDRITQALLVRDVVGSQVDSTAARALLQSAPASKDPLTRAAAMFGVIGVQLLRKDAVRAPTVSVSAHIAEARVLVRQIPDTQLQPAAFAALAAAQAATADPATGQEIFEESLQSAQSFAAAEQRSAAYLRIVNALDERLPFLGQPLRLDVPSANPDPS